MHRFIQVRLLSVFACATVISCARESSFSGNANSRLSNNKVGGSNVENQPSPSPSDIESSLEPSTENEVVSISTENKTIFAGESLEFDVIGTSSLQAPLSWSIDPLHNAKINPATGRFEWQTSIVHTGEHNVTIRAKGKKGEVSRVIQILVTDGSSAVPRSYELCSASELSKVKLAVIHRNSTYGSEVKLLLRPDGVKVDTFLQEGPEYNITFDPSIYTQFWFVSGCGTENGTATGLQKRDQTLNQLVQAYGENKGLAIFADNDPCIHGANLLSQRLGLANPGVNTFSGFSEDGTISLLNMTMVSGSSLTAGKALSHSLFSGLARFWSGITLSQVNPAQLNYPTTVVSLSPKGFSSIAVVREKDHPNRRLTLDGGFTKFAEYHEPGTGRYLRNLACYLNGHGNR